MTLSMPTTMFSSASATTATPAAWHLLDPPKSAATTSPTPSISTADDEFDRRHRLEVAFCRDYCCCGVQLRNLFELLEHYESSHQAPSPSSASSSLGGSLSSLRSPQLQPIGAGNAGVSAAALTGPLQQHYLAQQQEQQQNQQQRVAAIAVPSSPPALVMPSAAMADAHQHHQLPSPVATPLIRNHGAVYLASGTGSSPPPPTGRFPAVPRPDFVAPLTLTSPRKRALNHDDAARFALAAGARLLTPEHSADEDDLESLAGTESETEEVDVDGDSVDSAVPRGPTPPMSPRRSVGAPAAPAAANAAPRVPTKCPVPTCTKRYLSASGLRYHLAHAHPNDPAAVVGNANKRRRVTSVTVAAPVVAVPVAPLVVN
ncbi:Transcriptional regulator of ribosomal biogenesis proteins [Blastocladiella emersonii ATCC 22665]|nr:Transcriptional regulator of ribosomal biogenesis proteins [Blastocladiella emersonii ATCC 22665]